MIRLTLLLLSHSNFVLFLDRFFSDLLNESDLFFNPKNASFSGHGELGNSQQRHRRGPLAARVFGSVKGPCHKENNFLI